jgi:hypothetical protein
VAFLFASSGVGRSACWKFRLYGEVDLWASCDIDAGLLELKTLFARRTLGRRGFFLKWLQIRREFEQKKTVLKRTVLEINLRKKLAAVSSDCFLRCF